MNSSRIVVIDEDQSEALTLLSTLGKLGMGAIYIPGDKPEDIPDKPIEGIRLVFLDLKLIPAGEPKDFVPHAGNVMCESVCFEKHATGIVCWTKDPNDVELVSQELEKRSVLPSFLTHIDDKLQICGEGDVVKLAGEISKISTHSDSGALLHQFEDTVHLAATRATDSIASICDKQDEMMYMLAVSYTHLTLPTTPYV